VNVETPPPLNDAAIGMPSIWTCPPFCRPPFAVKNVMSGVAIALSDPVLVESPGIALSSAPYVRVAGIVFRISAFSTTSRRVVWVSTMGDSPVTVIVSCRVPTRISALIGTTPDPRTSTSSRLNTLKPLNVNVIEYVPGGRSVIRY
jgi:hypothetical protein